MAPGTLQGLFITFEGIEGSGKSTQIQLLAERLQAQNYTCVVTREPGGTALAEKIRDLLLDPEHTTMSPRAELLLYAASRNQHLHEKIIPALERGDIVICDRFYDSTTAYQGAGRVLEPALIQTVTDVAVGSHRPDLTFFIDVPVAVGLDRIRQRHGQLDRLESETLDFHERVREGYLAIAQNEPERVVLIDGMQPIPAVQQQIYHHLTTHFPSFL
ncbi:MAG: dTMP kinase [Gemmatimonadetes bacterium]|nr:MAG: dTMP kinase [Gemmatimonadota bacterium]